MCVGGMTALGSVTDRALIRRVHVSEWTNDVVGFSV